MRFFIISFFALILLPLFSICHAEISPDSYEEDDNIQQSQKISINAEPQSHNFHREGDVDWVRFYGFAEKRYGIKVFNHSTSCNIVIELYDADEVILQGPMNRGFEGEDEYMEWDDCNKDNFYFVKISLKSGSCNFNESTNYDLSVRYPDAPENYGELYGCVYLAGTKIPVQEVLITTKRNETDYRGSDDSESNGFFWVHMLEEGTHELSANHEYYQSYSKMINIEQSKNICEPIYLKSLSCQKEDSNGDINGDGGVTLEDIKLAFDFQQSLKGLPAEQFCEPNVCLAGEQPMTSEQHCEVNIPDSAKFPTPEQFCAANIYQNNEYDNCFVSIEDVKAIFDTVAGK